VALAWGLHAPQTLAGLVLVAGYYYPTTRYDAMFVAAAATPLLGPLLRNTLSPPFTRAALGSTLKGMFAPRPVPERFLAEVPLPLISRPGQLRAIAEDGAAIAEEAIALLCAGAPVSVPVAVVTGDADKVVGFRDQSLRLAADLGAPPAVVPGAGHMVHHAAPEVVARAVESVAGATRPGAASAAAPGIRPQQGGAERQAA
jgi:pimeloyl-ACP methyl ester carboxylesterase